MAKHYYTTAKNGDEVEVSREVAQELVASGKKKHEDFTVEDDGSPAPVSKADKAQSAKALRAQAASTYLADEEARKKQSVTDFAAENPSTYAMFPRSSTAVARGDRGIGGSIADAVKDVTSFPGRTFRAAVPAVAGLAADATVGTGIDGQSTGEQYMQDMGQLEARKAPGFWGGAEDMASSIVTDPYAVPLAAAAGPVIGRVAPVLAGAAPWVQKAVALGVDPLLNIGIGVTERATNPDPTRRAFAPGSMAWDATTGGLASGLGYGVRRASDALGDMGLTTLGGAIIERTPKKLREALINKWSPDYAANAQDAKVQAARNIGEHMTTDLSGNPVPLGVLRGRETNVSRMLTNKEQRLREANKSLDNTYDMLEGQYREDLDRKLGVRDFNNPFSESGTDPRLDPRQSGVDIQAASRRAQDELGYNEAIAPDMTSIIDEGNRIQNRLGVRGEDQYGRLVDGTLGPRAARDLRNRLHSEIRDRPASADLDQYHRSMYADINSQLEGQVDKYTRAAAAEHAAEFGDADPGVANILAEANKLSQANKEISKGLSLEPGLSSSQYWNPNSEHSPFGKTMDDMRDAALLSHPALLVRALGGRPATQVALSQSLARSAPIVSAVGTGMTAGFTGNRASAPGKDAKQRQDLERLQGMSARNLTEMEHTQLQSILRKPAGDRTGVEVAYAKKYGF